MIGTPRQRYAPAYSSLSAAETALGFVAGTPRLIDTAIGYKLALAGVVPEVLDERDHAVGVKVAPEPVAEIEFVHDPGVLANGEACDCLAVGAVTPVYERVERLEHVPVVGMRRSTSECLWPKPSASANVSRGSSCRLWSEIERRDGRLK